MVLRRVFVSLMIVLVSVYPLLADDLTGKVLDPDGRAVPNASVRLYERNSGEVRVARASSDGTYSFRGISGGEYLLEGDASDSALNGSKQVTVSGNQTENLDLKVSSRSTEISVIANSTPLSVQATGKAVDVIDAKELALRNEITISESLRTLPGIRVQTLEGPGSFTEIKTRGLRAADTALLIDGMRFHDAASIQNDATSFYEDMTIVDTDRIEVLRGAASSLYGSNALGGVINVVSRSGGGPTRGSLRVEGGGLGMVRGVGGLSGGFINDRLTYSGAGSHLYVTKGVRDPLPYRNNSLQGTSKFSFTPKISVTGRAWYSSNYLNATESPTWTTGMPSNPNGAVEAIALPISELEKFEKGQTYSAGNATFIPNGIDPDGRRKGSFLSGMALFQHQVSPNTSYRAGYQVVDTRRGFTDGPQGPGLFEPGPGDKSNLNGYIDTFQARLDQRAGRHNLISVGYEGEQEQYLGFDGGAYGVSASNQIDLKQRSHAIYIQDQFSLLDSRLQFTAAGRAQFFDLKQPYFQGTTTNPYESQIGTLDVPTAYTGDGAMAYFLEGIGTKFRAHVGNSFRAPSGYERFGGGFGSYYGDPRLAPERAVAFDTGIDQYLLDSRLELSGTFFYTNLQEIIRFASSFPAGTDPFNRTFGGYVNGGGGIARGVEVSGRFSPTAQTKLFASYTYSNSDSRRPTFGTTYFKVLDVSPHVVTVMATQWIARRTSVTFDMAAHSDYEMVLFGGAFRGTSRLFRFNGPVKGDVMVNHSLPFGDDHTLEIYGKVENVFNQRPYEDGFIGPKAWFITGARVSF